MGSAREGTVEHRPSLLKCHYDCLFVLRKELKFILATHTDGRVWTRRGAPAYNQVGRGGAVRPSRPIAKSATDSGGDDLRPSVDKIDGFGEVGETSFVACYLATLHIGFREMRRTCERQSTLDIRTIHQSTDNPKSTLD